VAIVGGAQTGGGFTYAASTVLLCASVTATLARAAPGGYRRPALPGQPASKGGKLYGQVNQTVTLER
jgi:hypothetical protein